MIPLSRETALDLLADSVIDHMENGGDHYFGLDGKRPFGFSGRSGITGHVLELLGAEPEGSDEGWSEAQEDEAMDLFDGVLDHINARWKSFRAGG